MNYTVGEMANRIGVAPSTLRYYEKAGLLPFAERTDGGARVFKESDYEWLQVILCLKKTGMQLADIKSFVQMAMRGDETIEPRLQLIVKQRKEVEKQIAQLGDILKVLQFKEWYYTTAKENGTTDVPQNMSIEEIPEHLRSARASLRGENQPNDKKNA